LAVEPGSAYLENQLALLHLSAGNRDSARYYAEKAVRSAPKWRCATLTLLKTQETQQPKEKEANTPKRNIARGKLPRFGGIGGFGYSNPTVGFNPLQNDTVRAVTMDGAIKTELGFFVQVP